MKILITGSNGFIGRHILKSLQKNNEVKTYNKGDAIDTNVDMIFHCAGIMRNEDKELFYKVNYELTKEIISKLTNQMFIYLSTTQYNQDNDYGRSKRLGESATLEYPKGIVYRLSNTFGNGAKPNYNSVVSTWLYNIKHEIPITINNKDYELEICYIDDVVDCLLKKEHNKINYIDPTYKIKLGELAETIYEFKKGIEPVEKVKVKLYEAYKRY